MATLADELLNDFEDSGSEGEAEGDAEQHHGFNRDESSPPPARGGAQAQRGSMLLDGDEEEDEEDDETAAAGILQDGVAGVEDEEEAKAKVEKLQLGGVNDVRNVASLMKTLEPVLQKIEHFQNLPPEQQTTDIGSIEDNPEYHLLTQSNTLSTSIDNEIILVHKFIRDHYSTRFPELETLVSNPLDYARSVAIIGNGPMDDFEKIAHRTDNIVGASLESVLERMSLMVVKVEATTSKGRTMTEAELQRVLRACEMTMSLDRAKKILTEYVQSRMNRFAPNLTALIGSLTAAQLLNFTGGLTGLVKTAPCNLPPLGSKKQSQTALSTNVGIRNQGFLYHCDIILGIPTDLKVKAMRTVSNKIVLAARLDSLHKISDGSYGEELRSECLDHFEKLTEPPPNKGQRALPAPDDKPSRKRGGRRVRNAKAATAMTDLRKEQNRMAFGKEEKEIGYADSSKGLGMIGQQNDGRIRSIQTDQRTKAKLSKNNKGWGTATPIGSGTATSLRGFGQSGGNSTVLRAGHGLRSTGVGDGTASSIAFTPVQGLELVDPKKSAELKRKAAADDDRYFRGGTFTQVGPSSAGGAAGGAAAPNGNGAGIVKDGFKVPGLPARKMAKTE